MDSFRLRSRAATVASFFLLTIAGCTNPIGSNAYDVDSAQKTYPIVLVHGLGLSGGQWNGTGIAPALREAGYTVFTPTCPLYMPPSDGAQAVAAAIDEARAKTGASKVHLIAQSMGALVARIVVSELGYGDRVASLTSVSGPHQGSNLADAALYLWDLPFHDSTLPVVAQALGLPADIDLDEVRSTVEALTEANAPSFNQAHPDDPRVYYESYAGITAPNGDLPDDAWQACNAMKGGWQGGHVSTALETFLGFIAGHEFHNDPNDAFVTVASAHWGVFRGCVGASHDELAGNDSGPDPRTGFEVVTFYRGIADDLAKRFRP